MIPHNLQLVIDFVNTLDVEHADDHFTTPAALAQWLQSRDLLERSAPPLANAQLGRAIELREGLRAALLAHNASGHGAAANRELDRAAREGQLSVHFNADGAVYLRPRADGFAGVLARLLVPAAQAAADGTWERVKACRADDCRWAFYDRSRNRSGRWCDMAVCGNRTKVRAYRIKRQAG